MTSGCGPSAPTSSVWTIEVAGLTTLRETAVPGPIPLHGLAGWRGYGVVAGITGRGPEPGRGFDLGLWSDAPVGETMARWRAFRRAHTGFDAVVLGHQVHGIIVDTVAAARGWCQVDGVDGWVTATAGVLLTVTVADCIPVYLVVRAPGETAPQGVALLHAGWRGTAQGILAAGVERLTQLTGAPAGNIMMHCGVGICGACYEVGAEVMTACGARADGPGPWHVDLRDRLARQAATLGIAAVSTSPWCSGHDRSLYYSHRHSGGRDGRMVAYLGIPRSD